MVSPVFARACEVPNAICSFHKEKDDTGQGQRQRLRFWQRQHTAEALEVLELLTASLEYIYLKTFQKKKQQTTANRVLALCVFRL